MHWHNTPDSGYHEDCYEFEHELIKGIGIMIRNMIAAGTGLLFSALLLGCASTPSADAPAAAVDPAPTAAAETSAATEAVATQAEVVQGEAREPKVVQTTAQARKYASEDEIRRAYRECMRKMRRITGSRIPRNACQGSAGLHGNAWNQRQEGTGQVSNGPGD